MSTMSENGMNYLELEYEHEERHVGVHMSAAGYVHGNAESEMMEHFVLALDQRMARIQSSEYCHNLQPPVFVPISDA